MSDGLKNLRNAAIIVGIALVVWLVPGGSEAGLGISNLLSMILLGGLAFFGYRMYMEHRVTLDGLGDRGRTILYGSIGLAVLAVAATSRMWQQGITALLWFAMLGAAAYGVYSVWRTAREY